VARARESPPSKLHRITILFPIATFVFGHEPCYASSVGRSRSLTAPSMSREEGHLEQSGNVRKACHRTWAGEGTALSDELSRDSLGIGGQ
jgi:hypothetical protein